MPSSRQGQHQPAQGMMATCIHHTVTPAAAVHWQDAHLVHHHRPASEHRWPQGHAATPQEIHDLWHGGAQTLLKHGRPPTFDRHQCIIRSPNPFACRGVHTLSCCGRHQTGHNTSTCASHLPVRICLYHLSHKRLRKFGLLFFGPRTFQVF